MHNRLTTGFTTLLLLAVATSQPGCDEDPPTWEPTGTHYSQCLSQPQPARQSIDLLFVVDDSTAMAGFEERLDQNMTAIIQTIQSWSFDLPDLHLGVVTTVLGTGPHAVDGCPQVGHEGELRTGTGAGPEGATYLKDVKPSGCAIECPDATGVCANHFCEEANCGHEPGTWLVIDEDTGCPRCRNYHGRLVDAFRDTARAGASSCPFSQPMEAMKLALQNDANQGFHREGSFLGIVFIAAQDDCSASGTDLFAPEDAVLGPLTAFRCFEHGVTCDPNGRGPGPRSDCQSSEDPEGLLAPPSAYVEFLQGVVEPSQLMVAGIVGPFAVEDVITVELDAQGQPRLVPSCTQDATMTASPAVRLHSLLAAFNEEEDLTWAETSICDADYTNAFRGVSLPGCTLREPGCFELPLRGCTDPGAAMGEPRDAQVCNDACQPNCTVTDIQRRGLPEETALALPHCLEVCVDGPCPGNTDATQAYAEGIPAKRDYRLPVPACWYVSAEQCSDTGEVIVARQADPPRRSFVDICCELAPDVETDCHDGLDEDGDCLVDLDDPDCAGQ